MTDILADTSIWVSHFRKPLPALRSLLATDQVLHHPLVMLELACGMLPSPRQRVIEDLRRLRPSVVATVDETLYLIEQERLPGSGCGAVDLSLLASVLITPDSLIWTLDQKLHAVATRLGVAFPSSND